MDGVNWVSRVNWKWVDWSMVKGNSMHWCGVNWCGVNWVVSRRGVGITVVLNISNISPIAINISRVVHNLDATIRQGHFVLSSHNIGIRVLVLVKAGTRVVVMDPVLKSIGFGGLGIAMNGFVDGHMVHWHWMHWNRVHW